MNAGALALAAAAGAAAAALNSAAGGGSFISFPTLVFLGIPPISANATNSVAMWFGGAGSIGGYRDLLEQPSGQTRWAIGVSLAGGVVGGVLLLHTPAKTFSATVPWLLLFATALFAFGPLLLRTARGASGPPIEGVRELPRWGMLPLFLVSVYGGFFGGGQGFLILALFTLLGMLDVQRANALKIVLSFVNNGAPLLPFVLSGLLHWQAAAATSAGALVGGYYGAKGVRRIPDEVLRGIIVVIGTVMTVVFFRGR